MGGVPSGGNSWKNILIGIATTVVAYTIVNYIKDRKEKKKEKEKIKIETIESWKSLIRYEELSTDNYFASFCNEDPVAQLESMIYEKEQLAKNYEIIGNRQGIDDNLASFATRAVGNTNEIRKLLESYLDDVKKIDPASPDKERAYNTIDSLYLDKLERARERDTASLNSTFRNLVEKFGQDFTTPVKEKMPATANVIGKWKETGIDKTFNLSANNTFVMSTAQSSFSGTWKLDGNEIDMKFDDGSGTIVIRITRFNARYIRFTLDDETTERQMCKN